MHTFLRMIGAGLLLLCLAGSAYAAPTTTRPHAARIAYVALGDSLTFGHGADDPITQSYPAVLAHRLPSGSLFLNLGRNGNTVIEASGTDLDSATDAHPTLITVQIGLNDVGNGVPLEKVEANFGFLLKTLSTTHAALFVLNYPDVLALPDSAGATGFAQTVVAYNRFIAAEAARRHAHVIDIYAASKRLYGDPANVSSGFHLTAKGYAVMADICFSTMRKYGAI